MNHRKISRLGGSFGNNVSEASDEIYNRHTRFEYNL